MWCIDPNYPLLVTFLITGTRSVAWKTVIHVIDQNTHGMTERHLQILVIMYVIKKKVILINFYVKM